jgi:hypothetical protein
MRSARKTITPANWGPTRRHSPSSTFSHWLSGGARQGCARLTWPQEQTHFEQKVTRDTEHQPDLPSTGGAMSISSQPV